MTAEILSTREIPTSIRLRLLSATFKSVLGDSDYCQMMLKAADELEKAQRDTARLDWLDGKKSYSDNPNGHPDNPHPQSPDWLVWGRSSHGSIREAIDYHMSKAIT